MENLWPRNFDVSNEGEKFPILLLKEQIVEFNKMKLNNISGAISEGYGLNEFNLVEPLSYIKSFNKDNNYSYTFIINNKYPILSISFNNSLYPLRMAISYHFEKEIKDIIQQQIKDNYYNEVFRFYNISSENEFKLVMKLVFNSNSFKMFIQMLMDNIFI